ncbi:hypothetical protein HDU93_001868 [Gonapodya sp. JEL0774]|nr:hypothetical protein HDU93_001868 [Gonapodya sp. JEL0774]
MSHADGVSAPPGDPDTRRPSTTPASTVPAAHATIDITPPAPAPAPAPAPPPAPAPAHPPSDDLADEVRALWARGAKLASQAAPAAEDRDGGIWNRHSMGSLGRMIGLASRNGGNGGGGGTGPSGLSVEVVRGGMGMGVDEVQIVKGDEFGHYFKNWAVTFFRFFHGYLYLVAFALVVSIGVNFQLSVFFTLFSNTASNANYAGVMARLSLALLFGVVISVIATIVWRHFSNSIAGVGTLTLRKTPAAVDDYLVNGPADSAAGGVAPVGASRSTATNTASGTSAAGPHAIPLWLQGVVDLAVQIIGAFALDIMPIMMAVLYHRSNVYDFLAGWLQWAILGALFVSLFYSLAEATNVVSQTLVNIATAFASTRGQPFFSRVRLILAARSSRVSTLHNFVAAHGFRLLKTGATYITSRSAKLWLGYRFIERWYYLGWLLIAASGLFVVEAALFVRAIVLSGQTGSSLLSSDTAPLPTAYAPTMLFLASICHAWGWLRPWAKIAEHYRTAPSRKHARELPESTLSNLDLSRSPEPFSSTTTLSRDGTAAPAAATSSAPKYTRALAVKGGPRELEPLTGAEIEERFVTYVMFDGKWNSWISGVYIGLLLVDVVLAGVALSKMDTDGYNTYVLVLTLLFVLPYLLNLAAYSFIVTRATLEAAKRAGNPEAPLRRFYFFNRWIGSVFFIVLPLAAIVFGLVWYIIQYGSVGTKVGTVLSAIIYIVLALLLIVFLTHVDGFPTTIFLGVYGILFLLFILIFITAATFTSGSVPNEAYAGFIASFSVKALKVKPGDVSFGSGSGYRTGPPGVCGIDVANLSVVDYAMMAMTAYDNRENVSRDLSTWMGSDWVVNHYNSNPSRNLSVIAVRGTYSLTDILTDMDLWSESALLQVSDFLLPTVRIWPVEFTQNLVDIGSMTSWLNVTEFKFQNITNHVRSILQNATLEGREHDVVLTGHSLGGGLASIVAAQAGVRSVVFSPPGILFSAKKFGISQERTDTLAASLTSIVVDKDVVSKVDDVPGAVFHVPCDETFISCHSLVRTTAMLQSWCGDTGRFMYLSGYCDYLEKFGGGNCTAAMRR